MISRFFKLLFSTYLYYGGGLRKRIQKLQMTDCIIPIYDHNPNPEEFEKYIKWLINTGFEFATYNDVLTFLKNPDKYGCKVWITFDDGWSGNIALHEILKKYNIQVTIFITTKAIETGFFRDSLESSFKELLPREFKDNPKDLKKIPNSLRSEIDTVLFSNISDSIVRESLTFDQIKKLSNYSQYNFQAHTHTHPNFLQIEISELENEVLQNIQILEEITASKITSLSFPYGKYNEELVSRIYEFGIEFMVSVGSGIIYKEHKKKVLPRNGIANASFYENCCRMLDFWYPNTKKIKSIFIK